MCGKMFPTRFFISLVLPWVGSGISGADAGEKHNGGRLVEGYGAQTKHSTDVVHNVNTRAVVVRGENPSMGFAFSSKVYWWHCGASIVTPTLAFTTADCCIPAVSWWANGALPQNDLSLKVGSISQLTAGATSTGPIQTKTSKFYVHPLRKGKYRYNYCMLELDTPLTLFGNDVAPITGIYPKAPAVGTTLWVFRWTTTDTQPPYRMTLDKQPCTVPKDEVCYAEYPDADLFYTVCCYTPNNVIPGKIEANQLMFQAPNGSFLLVGHQLTYGRNLDFGLFNLALWVESWIKNPRPPQPTTTTPTPTPINSTALTAARVEADPKSLTSMTLSQFSERLGQDLYSWYAARSLNWTQLLLVNTTKELPAQVETLRREIAAWEKISKLSGNELLPQPSLIAAEVSKRLHEIPGLDQNGVSSVIGPGDRTKTSTLVELESIKALDKRELTSVYGRRGLAGVNTTHWLAAPLTRNLIDPLRTGLQWLEFLQLTLQTLSSGHIQSGSKTDLATKIGRCDPPVDTTLLNCLTNIFQTFQKPVENLTPAGILQIFKALNPTAQQQALNDLKGIIEVTLKENTLSCTYDVDSLTLVARGRFVTLSSILKVEPLCVRAYPQGRIKNLVIFASSTFFMDSDVRGVDIAGREGDPLSLTIFAPWWEVTPRNNSSMPWTLDLRGADGKDAPSTKPGANVLGVGLDGAPGGPGQNGGNFQVMGQGIINYNNYSGTTNTQPPTINVLLAGGEGGRGQAGGDGAPGVDGTAPEFSTASSIDDPPSYAFNPYEYVKRYPVHCDVARLATETIGCPYKDRVCWAFTCPGSEGRPGGNGGGGGKGGVAGNPGIFNDYLGYSGFNANLTGPTGVSSTKHGKGGNPGYSSRKGPKRLIIYVKFFGGRDAWWQRTVDEIAPFWLNDPYPNRGPIACDGCSTINPVAPSPSPPRNRYWSGYLAFALDPPQLFNLYTQTSLSSFLVRVEGRSEFQLRREMLEPFQDLQSIEIAVARMQDKKAPGGLTLAPPPDLKPLLNAFLTKVYRLANLTGVTNNSNLTAHPGRGIPPAEYRKALFALYTAAYSRLESFSDLRPEPLLVVNVAGYLKNAAEAFKELQTSQQNLQRLAIVSQTNREYQKDIEAKFREADLFVTLVLNPALEKSLKQIDQGTDELVNQIIKLQNSATQDLQALHDLQQKLQARAPLTALLGTLSMLGSALAVFGPKGEAAGTVINLAAGAGEAAILAGNPDDVPLTNIPPSITTADAVLAQKLKAKNEAAMKVYWDQLNRISELLRQDGSADAQPLQTEITTIKARLTEFHSKINDTDVRTDSLLALEASTNFTTLHREFQANLSAAFNAALRPPPKSQRALFSDSDWDLAVGPLTTTLTRVGRWDKPDAVERAERVAAVSLDTYVKYRGNQARLDVVARSIVETKAALAAMDVQKENVEGVMKPVLVQMRADLDRARQTMGKQSPVALTVNQWQVQQMLKTLKAELRKMFTAGFSALDDSLTAAFDSLQETMTTLTNVYDKLETLQGQAKLANLISRGQSAALSNVIVHNPDLNRALNNLQGVIQSVVVSEQYEFALKSFNTWIFPFARFFSSEFNLPVGMQSLMMNASQSLAGAGASGSINASMNAEAFVQRLLDTVGNRLDKLRLRMGEYTNTIMIFDGALIPKAQFYRPRPFYTWPANKFKGQIAALLKGDRVTLNADVRSSNKIFHAVKFRKVKLEFGVVGNMSSATPQIVNDYLSHFTVRLVHTGNSGYRYGNSSYFNVMTPSLRLEYRYSPPGAPYPVDANGIYDKVMSGDLSLSPYTMWDVQLFAHSPETGDSIPGAREVMRMAAEGGLDLYLVGEGSRVTSDLFSEDQLQLDLFYNKDTANNGTRAI